MRLGPLMQLLSQFPPKLHGAFRYTHKVKLYVPYLLLLVILRQTGSSFTTILGVL